MLAQQIVAEVAAQDWPEAELYDRLRRAWPFRSLRARISTRSLRMLAEGFTTRRGRRGALIHRDAVNRILRGRRGARTTALTSGGTIPDTADYQVLLEPENQIIGTVNEDFAVESMAGDIFQLGNASYRIQRVERGTVRVEDAKGQPPNIPFWLGEAPGRTDELSAAVSRLRAEIAGAARAPTAPDASPRRWLVEQVGVAAAGGRSARRLSRRERLPPSAACRRRTRSSSSASSTRRAACSSSFTRRSAAASIAPGAWRCASASAANSISSCRRRRPRTISCCR